MRMIFRLRSASPSLQRLLQGAAWSVAGSVAARLLALGASIAISRILLPEGFGRLLVVQSTLGTFGAFAGLGLGVVAAKFSAELHARDPERLGRILNLVRTTALYGGALAAVVLAILSRFIATELYGLAGLSPLLALASVSILFLTVDGYNSAALIGLDRIKLSVQGTLASAVAATASSIGLGWAFGLDGAIWGVLLSAALQCFTSHVLLARVLRERNIAYSRFGRDEWTVLRNYAAPSLIGGMMVAPVHWVCQILLANTPDGIVQVAVLGIAFQWFQAVYFLPMALGRVVLPIMTDVVVGEGNGETGAFLKSAVLANAAVSAPFAVAIGALSGQIMRLYGVEAPYAWAALALMVAASTVSAFCAPVGQVMVAQGKIWHGTVMNMGWALVYVGSTWLFLNLLGLGAVGVACGLLLAYVVHGAWVCAWTWNSFEPAGRRGSV